MARSILARLAGQANQLSPAEVRTRLAEALDAEATARRTYSKAAYAAEAGDPAAAQAERQAAADLHKAQERVARLQTVLTEAEVDEAERKRLAATVVADAQDKAVRTALADQEAVAASIQQVIAAFNAEWAKLVEADTRLRNLVPANPRVRPDLFSGSAYSLRDLVSTEIARTAPANPSANALPPGAKAALSFTGRRDTATPIADAISARATVIRDDLAKAKAGRTAA